LVSGSEKAVLTCSPEPTVRAPTEITGGATTVTSTESGCTEVEVAVTQDVQGNVADPPYTTADVEAV
jgi:hypothetical protein